jgi:hypothetical protein
MNSEEIAAVAEFVLAMGPGTEEASITSISVPDTTTGRLYMQLCATCHGETGKGRGTVAPFGENLEAAGVATIIRNGGPRMPDYPDLSEEAVGALVAHTLLLANGEPDAADGSDGDDSDAVAAAANTAEPTASGVHNVQTPRGGGVPTSALAVVGLGILGLAGAVGYTRIRASRNMAQ